MKFLVLVLSLVIVSFAAPATVSAEYKLVDDFTLDLYLVKFGREFSVNLGFAGAGVRIFPADRSTVIDLQPTFLDPVLGSCKIPKLNTMLPWCKLDTEE